jgi:muramoyltetrapeptide carboxypeptidase
MSAIPPRLRDGDRIGVCSPAGAARSEDLRPGLDLIASRYAVELGAVTRGLVDGSAAGDPSGYLAASDEARAAELDALIRNRDVRAIWLARGGYGILRILSRLDGTTLAADPKPIIGYSDATALLSWADHHGVRGIHGPMVKGLAQLPPEHATHVLDLLARTEPLGELPFDLAEHGATRTRFGGTAGHLVVGNLALVSMLVGTPWPVRTAGAIVALEEVAEEPYAIDRYLMHLGLAGQLDGVAAIVLGDFTRCTSSPDKAPDDPSAAIAAVKSVADRYARYLLSGLPIGHGPRNFALPYGARCAIDLDAGVMSIDDPAVT